MKPETSGRKRQRKFREEEAGAVQGEVVLEGSGHTLCRVSFSEVNSMNKETAQHQSTDGRLESGNSNKENIINLIGEKLRSKVEMSVLGNRRNSSQDDSLTGIILRCKGVEKFHCSFYINFSYRYLL